MKNLNYVCSIQSKTATKNDYSIMGLRSFLENGPYGIQITHVRVSSNKKYGEFLVKYKTPTFEYSSWKRYTLLKEFYNDLIQTNNTYINTKISWDVLQRRLCWRRNLNIEYLKMKAFFLCHFHYLATEGMKSCKGRGKPVGICK